MHLCCIGERTKQIGAKNSSIRSFYQIWSPLQMTWVIVLIYLKIIINKKNPGYQFHRSSSFLSLLFLSLSKTWLKFITWLETSGSPEKLYIPSRHQLSVMNQWFHSSEASKTWWSVNFSRVIGNSSIELQWRRGMKAVFAARNLGFVNKWRNEWWRMWEDGFRRTWVRR